MGSKIDVQGYLWLELFIVAKRKWKRLECQLATI